ncbi:type I methionyl aminopeptidase [Candidatus Woesebacteria bacterium RIFCSPHIGHO2_01_FULL_38_10]|uniref:Methionine aminopeptidase n=1 Tax=Candidatus Woesebacteria bacterium RIFCSPLOWO2_01_FULL_39_10b TaxID=1802517 RepID=A0A1F8B5E9_9BACT|nr:MAG: type I methionyl aminopeptidase [Candidatus Woesebacteria bacterium RIFCSPHIGHO2_01_FULL_38_10]OGM58939.1 MAG: type I methionyl aminopeptidase [Candidatus Woesebacteria bacterium RIFCSPLOWO2_01_FULL_39_10b]
MAKIKIKTPEELKKMFEGGRKLAKVKARLKEAVREGIRASEIDLLAEKLILGEGGFPSFKMVPNYSWSTCVNVNDGVVHGIPRKEIVFKKGDLVSVDLGIFYEGFHSDSSFSLGIDEDGFLKKFISLGERTLRLAIKKVESGNRIYDISRVIETSIKKEGYSPIRALVGHGIGKDLHEEPQIPCFTSGKRTDSPKIPVGVTLAIEVMYTEGSGEIEIGNDGWTIKTRDGKIAALFEETVALTETGSVVLTG